jgi:hypothetical protein
MPLDDKIIEELCQSNITFLHDLASIAPIAAVVQQDVKAMVDSEIRSSIERNNAMSISEDIPVTSQIQSDHALSRYNVLAMGIAASNSESGSTHLGRTQGFSPPHGVGSDSGVSSLNASSGNLYHERMSTLTFNAAYQPRGATAECLNHSGAASVSYPLQQQSRDLDMGEIATEFNTAPTNGVIHEDWLSPTNLVPDVWFSNDLPLEYSVAGSRFDMSGELDWFLANAATHNT